MAQSCRDRDRRERLVAEVMGKLESIDFLNITTAKSASQKNSVEEERRVVDIESVDVADTISSVDAVVTPSSEELEEPTPSDEPKKRASHLASLDSL